MAHPRRLSNEQTCGRQRANIVNLEFGARAVRDSRHSFYAGYGHALTDATWYDDILRFEYRFSF